MAEPKFEMPEPAIIYLPPGEHADMSKAERWYSASQLQAAYRAGMEAAKVAVAELATQSRDREERDLIGKCWLAIDAAIRAEAARGRENEHE